MTDEPEPEETVFLTLDENQRSGLGDHTTAADQAVLRSVETGEGLITLTPERLKELMVQAAATMDYFQSLFVDMPKDMAVFVRSLRVDQGYTWRAVAAAVSLKMNLTGTEDDWGSNQLCGMAICEAAAKQFDEDFMTGVWNG